MTDRDICVEYDVVDAQTDQINFWCGQKTRCTFNETRSCVEDHLRTCETCKKKLEETS